MAKSIYERHKHIARQFSSSIWIQIHKQKYQITIWFDNLRGKSWCPHAKYCYLYLKCSISPSICKCPHPTLVVTLGQRTDGRTDISHRDARTHLIRQWDLPPPPALLQALNSTMPVTVPLRMEFIKVKSYENDVSTGVLHITGAGDFTAWKGLVMSKMMQRQIKCNTCILLQWQQSPL